MKSINLLAALSFLLLLASCSQGEKIDNEITKEHIEIQSTGIYLILPQGFEISEIIPGFEHGESGSSIYVANLHNSFTESLQKYEFDMVGLNAKNVTKTDYQIGGMDGKYIRYVVETEGMELAFEVLLFGNDVKTTTIHGTMPLDWDAKIGSYVKKSILSVAFKDY